MSKILVENLGGKLLRKIPAKNIGGKLLQKTAAENCCGKFRRTYRIYAPVKIQAYDGTMADVQISGLVKFLRLVKI